MSWPKATCEIVRVHVLEGPPFELNTEDGPTVTHKYSVSAELPDGRRLAFPYSFPVFWYAEMAAEKLAAVGSIDPLCFVEESPPHETTAGELEARWNEDARRGDMARRGFISEEEIYLPLNHWYVVRSFDVDMPMEEKQARLAAPCIDLSVHKKVLATTEQMVAEMLQFHDVKEVRCVFHDDDHPEGWSEKIWQCQSGRVINLNDAAWTLGRAVDCAKIDTGIIAILVFRAMEEEAKRLVGNELGITGQLQYLLQHFSADQLREKLGLSAEQDVSRTETDFGTGGDVPF